ncbi:Ketol-acid reductoisomerase [uncultured Avibacterium sp.]|uniref:Ketol-acid reductoisomerase (NADP(+)) n=1 Tax=uncultured Avibacterium sp. TaxID=1936169 RepID=A0A486XDW3_9PAST|nr:Ketol-acid reductoisomerase [uncultured Avibacterium sp.]
MLQAGSILCYDKLVAGGKDPAYAGKLVQYGWETITEALKQGGITLMMDRLSNSAKLRAFELAEEIKQELDFLFKKHMDDIISGEFSRVMMEDWANGDANLLKWREETGKTGFETHQKQTESKSASKNILIMAC